MGSERRERGRGGRVVGRASGDEHGGNQLDLGRERLQAAKERQQTLPFDLVDRMLGAIRRRIDQTSDLATVPMESYRQGRLAEAEQKIQTTVSQLRTAVVNGDGTAPMKLQLLQSQISMLELQSTIGSTLSAINLLKGELHNAESWLPERAREEGIYNELDAAMKPWENLGQTYDSAWQAGHAMDEAWINFIRTQVVALRSTTKLPELVQKVTSFAKDEATRQRWIAIGVIIAAVLASMITGGVAGGAAGGGMAGCSSVRRSRA